ncbi:MAG: response regulator transcription factor [Clostridia bacterium]|nr:response regulator transcription factor [Clostridia bacterium]
MKKILIIEDDTNINEMLSKLLKLNNYNVVSAYSGTEGILLHNENIDLILLDLMLPGKNGENIIQELQNKKKVPVIVISAIDDLDKKIDLFKLGADDYITKPFENDELLARIAVQLRHSSNNQSINKVFKFKDIELNTLDYTVKCNNTSVNLSKIEFKLLHIMLKNPNQVFTKNTLIEKVWNNEASADDNTLNVHISKLRSKLKEKNKNEDYIETVWSIGYKLKK